MSATARLTVFIILPSGEAVRAGELAFGAMRGNGEAPSAFRYAQTWLARPDAFALDPESLPLVEGEFSARNLGPPLAVFDDSLPDDWGRRLLAIGRAIPRREQTPWRYLLEAGRDTMGALAYGNADCPPPARFEAADLTRLALDAERFDRGEALDGPALHRLLAAGSSPGGARPKVVVEFEGVQWIAKFASPSRDGQHDVPGLEYVCLKLADACGVVVPPARLLEIAGRHVLLTRRFDRLAPSGACAGRRHMISLKTLCRERGGLFCLSYDEPMAMIRKHSASPRADIERFFRQMCFNAAIGNTDDHLKNFAMLRLDEGWRLSPAYDLVPDIGRNREHVLAIGPGRDTPDAATLIEVGRRWLGSTAAVCDIVGQVATAVTNFERVAKDCGLPAATRTYFAADIAGRLARIGSAR
jgi:serine/threonine-protein kinase HipA